MTNPIAGLEVARAEIIPVVNDAEAHPKGAIIFDADGTMIDNRSEFLKVVTEVLEREPFTEEEAEEIRDSSDEENLKRLKVPTERLPALIEAGRGVGGERMAKAKIFDGLLTAMDRLERQGYDFHTLTSNGETVREFLDLHGITGRMKTITTGANPYKKEDGIEVIAEQGGYEMESVFVVGDVVLDMLAAHKVGARAVAAGYGYDSIRLLSELGRPHAIASTPSQIPSAIEHASVNR